jgi:hypothetical protein
MKTKLADSCQQVLQTFENPIAAFDTQRPLLGYLKRPGKNFPGLFRGAKT